MERKAFLKLIGLGAVAAAVAPEILLSAPMPKVEPKIYRTGGIWQHMQETAAGLHPFEPCPYEIQDFRVYIGPDMYKKMMEVQAEMIANIPDEIIFGRKAKRK